LVETGAQEIMLLGQNVNCWYCEGDRMDLGDLIRSIAKIDGVKRIRYTTSYPSKITRNLIAAHADTPKLMPYIHLPIQAGSDKILRAMNRKYSVAEYEDIVAAFRAARPDIAVSSDFIVGFPGETDADFEQTMDLARRVRYASSFSFKFSARPGTPASLMKNQIPEAVKAERLKKLQALLLAQQKAFNQSCVGKETEVLLAESGKKPGQLIGYSPHMQGTIVRAPKKALNTIVRVKITQASATALTGSLIQTRPTKKET
ncbi:MAG: MiaB/RimO family radical SAM methylthiotransferase, partial [Alphaproteobacteria bacterium]|nr:MiaB/RimO family radical SAM methylthiotransferase [Alphaproteobacteria bacterium]